MSRTDPSAAVGARERLARLLGAWSGDLLLVAVLIAGCLLCRSALIGSLWAYAGPQADAAGVITALVRGFPFDCRTSVVIALPSVVLSLGALVFPRSRLRGILRVVLGIAGLTTLLLLGIIDHYYFREYANQFDHFVVGLVYDDTTAILRTVWQQHPVIWAALGTVLFAVLTAAALNRLLAREPTAWFARRSTIVLALLVPLFLAVIVCGARGSVSRLPAQSKNIAVTADEKLLNKLVLNPLSALNTAIGDYRENRLAGDRFTVQRAREALVRLTGATGDDLDAALVRTAAGAATPPRHVVLVILESQSAWPLEERMRPLGLAERLRAIGERGMHWDRFLSEGTGTMASVGPLLSGLPDNGLMQSYLPLARRALPTSLAPIFRRLGYRTRFFYSGYLSWQRLGDFVSAQGFEEINGGGAISDWTDGNEWGVDDRRLLTCVANHCLPDTATFDVVLTTSNHPPYSIDVAARGFPHRTMPTALAGIADDSADLHILGHLWFADGAVGDFVDRLRTAQPDTLIAITGDHYGRRFVNRAPDAWERTAVPLILTGPGVDGKTPASPVGSHLDLIPTLVERCAPAGFAYHALGHDLLATVQQHVATAAGGLTAGGAIEWSNTGDARDLAPATIAELHQLAEDRQVLSWWRLVRGPLIRLPATTARPDPAP